MTVRQREPRREDRAHLAFVRTRPCCVCKRAGPSEAAHIRMKCDARGKRETGMQEKPDDCWTTPLCAYCHRTGVLAQHKMGERDFWIRVGRDPFAIALDLWKQSDGAERALQSAPVKVKKIKARKPPERRKKIQAGGKIQSDPKIQSRGFDKRPPSDRFDRRAVAVQESSAHD